MKKRIQKFESFSSDAESLVTNIRYEKFERLAWSNKPEEISSNEVEKIYYLIDVEYPTPIIKYRKCKRDNNDSVESCIHFDMNFGGKNGEGYIIFYKFEDEWWLLETVVNIQDDSGKLTRYEYWLVDGMDGIEKWADIELEKILAI